jgi:hypothetical protein
MFLDGQSDIEQRRNYSPALGRLFTTVITWIQEPDARRSIKPYEYMTCSAGLKLFQQIR